MEQVDIYRAFYDYQEVFSKIGKIKGEVRYFDDSENLWQIIINEYQHELKIAKGLLIKMECNSTVSIKYLNESSILIDVLNNDCIIFLDPCLNEKIANKIIKCTIIFSGIV